VSGRAPPKKQRRHYSGKKKRHTQKAQVVIDPSKKRIVATAFAEGAVHDFTLFKQSRTAMNEKIRCLADSGYQGLKTLHPNSQTPKKKSKHHPLTPDEKASNRSLSRQRMLVEHIIGRLKVFRLLSERYRNRRKRFGLRFNLIAALYNLEYAL
jgi:transposase